MALEISVRAWMREDEESEERKKKSGRREGRVRAAIPKRRGGWSGSST